MTRLTITNAELTTELVGEATRFPKYATQLLNLANQNAQATRPRVVGQLSDMIQQCPYNSFDRWRAWYLKQRPGAIDEATKKLVEMVDRLVEVISAIDERMVREWVEDLVLVKTFIGLRFQEAILKRMAALEGKGYRLARPEEESRGIDGFVGDTPVSIKPRTYLAKKALPEDIPVRVVFYDKVKGGIRVDLG